MQERGLALFDIDGTIYDGYLTVPLMQAQSREGIVESMCVDKIFQLRENFESARGSYGDFVRELLVIWAEALRGQLYSRVLAQTEEFLQVEKERFFPAVVSLIESLRGRYDFHIVTGEPQFVGEAVRKLFRMSSHASSLFQVEGGILTGEIDRFVATGQDKLALALDLAKEYQLGHSLAFGDSEADIEMLSLVECPVCIRPSTLLRECAAQKGWRIFHPGDEIGLLLADVFS